ncbi:MAG TPA: hypothetical protein VGQ93_14915 [Lysobacter sp.]|jgi:hypothetical protein|nr:hypothetical protein [Lysobacter sp.]
MAVWIVDGWQPYEDDGQFGEWLLVVPDDTPVQRLDFRCIAGLFVLIQAATWKRVGEIAEQVDRFHPALMYGYPEDRDRLTYFQRRAA